MVEIDSAPGLRQVNAPAGSLAAYRFNGRPFHRQREAPPHRAGARSWRIASPRASRRRARWSSHALKLTVEKAGIYALELAVPPGFVVSEVKGEGVDDWKAQEGKLKISFASRVLGARKLDIQLEQANKEFPDKITVLPLAVTGATNVTTQLGAASSPGIRLKTRN